MRLLPEPPPSRKLGATAALLALVLAPAGSAAVLVSGIVTPVGGTFHYSLTIEITGPDDYSIVTLTGAPLGDPLIKPSLSGPAGFLLSYDDGLGYLDFVEDTDLFAAGSVRGPFTFDSLQGPGLWLDVFEAIPTDTTDGAPVSGKIDVTVVPEPAAAGAALALGLLGRALWARRRSEPAAPAC